MDKVETHAKLVRDLLEKHAKQKEVTDEVEDRLVFDTERHRYLLMSDGWRKQKQRVYGITIHIDVEADGKIWVQWNGTEEDFLETFTEKGVPIADIVNGMHMPYLREWRKTYRE